VKGVLIIARAIYDVPTALSGSEVWAIISLFLVGNGFSKTMFFGEELYEKKLEKSLLARLIRPRPPQSYRVKVSLGNGIMHLEIYRYYSGWEFPPGDMLDAYGRELMLKLQPYITQIASNQPGSDFFAEAPQSETVFQQPIPDQRYIPRQEQNRHKKRKIGLAVASMVLGIATLPLIPFIVPSIVIGIAGFSLGLASLLKKREGKGMAVAGVLLNTLGVVLEVVFILYLFIHDH